MVAVWDGGLMFDLWNHEELGWLLTPTFISFMILSYLTFLSFTFPVCHTAHLRRFTGRFSLKGIFPKQVCSYLSKKIRVQGHTATQAKVS